MPPGFVGHGRDHRAASRSSPTASPIPSVVEWVRATRSMSVPRIAASARALRPSGPPVLGGVAGCRGRGRASRFLGLPHGGGALAGIGAGAASVEVDPGARGGKGRAERAIDLLPVWVGARPGALGSDAASSWVPVMIGRRCPAPTLTHSLASPETGCPRTSAAARGPDSGQRSLRPDGTRHAIALRGRAHVPNATYVDWRADVQSIPGTSTRWLPPQRPPTRLLTAVPAPGSPNGKHGVVYDHDTARGLYDRRSRGRELRAIRSRVRRILDGGYGAWVDSGRPISHAANEPEPPGRRSRRAQRAANPADDERPGVALGRVGRAVILDARGTPAEYRGVQGTPPAGSTSPGAVNLRWR